MLLDVEIQDPRWQGHDLQTLAASACQAALDHLGLGASPCEISLLACDDVRITALNSEFRDKPRPTNVLSWPADDLAADTDGDAPSPPEPDPDGTITLGDIAISYDTCAAEALAAGKPFADHVTHLIVHGLLHLLGYDHLRDADATRMETLETEILGEMGLNDPYMDAYGQDPTLLDRI